MKRVLNHRHRDELHRSGLTDDTITSLGFYSGKGEEVEAILGFPAGPGLIMPYPSATEDELYFRIKPDKPLIINGRTAKHLSPKGARVKAYIPPKTWEGLKDPRAPLIITEGEKKAAKGDQEGFHSIGLGGMWGFSQNHQLIPELASGFKAVHPVTGKELTLKDTAVVATAENNILVGL